MKQGFMGAMASSMPALSATSIFEALSPTAHSRRAMSDFYWASLTTQSEVWTEYIAKDLVILLARSCSVQVQTHTSACPRNLPK